MAKIPSDLQAEVLIAIYEYIQAQEHMTPTPLPPSVRDIMPMIGLLSTSTTRARIHSLADSGYVVFQEEMKQVSRATTRLTHFGYPIARRLWSEQNYTNMEV